MDLFVGIGLGNHWNQLAILERESEESETAPLESTISFYPGGGNPCGQHGSPWPG